MTALPLALMLSRDAMLREMNSARPWAPVVPAPTPRPRRPHRVRAAIAIALRKAAEAVSPAPARDLSSPAH